jgi:hypothetical protein
VPPPAVVERKPLSKPTKNFIVQNRTFVVEEKTEVSIKNLTINKKQIVKPAKIPGPQASRYNSTVDKGFKKFKDGEREDASDKICKRRYTLLFITALGNVPITVPDSTPTPARLLQALTPAPTTSTNPKQTMYLTVSSEYFSSKSLTLVMSLATLAMIYATSILF